MRVGVAAQFMALRGDGSHGIRETFGDLPHDEKRAPHLHPAQEFQQPLRQLRQGRAAKTLLPLGGVKFLEIDREKEGFH